MGNEEKTKNKNLSGGKNGVRLQFGISIGYDMVPLSLTLHLVADGNASYEGFLRLQKLWMTKALPPEINQETLGQLQWIVRKGFKLRSSFTRNAWEDMVASMNMRFAPQLEKEVLQNRSEKFKQQYNIVKALIQQNGFHWDGTGRMVVAEDDVRDDYIKEHTRAAIALCFVIFYPILHFAAEFLITPRQNHTGLLSVPNYDDFCVIYGEASACQVVKFAHYASPKSPSNDRLLRSSQVVDGGGKQLPSSSDRTRINWTLTMDRYFVEIMVEQVLKGYKNNALFRGKAWKLWSPCSTTNLNLLEQDGFHFDHTKEKIVAEDHVWDDYIKVHPEARAYRKVIVPCFKDLCVIFGNEHSVTPSVNLDVATPEVKQQSESSQFPTVSAANDDMCLVRLCVIRSKILEALSVFLVILFPLLIMF
ncbi:Myb/SANT-like domain [Dillenia turbinata]|uniref:Myb/SANT-like domain n=1 Tax=Dillenia turbinata TaxID=194707 RepID=A0AAN8ZI59_9MAGN